MKPQIDFRGSIIEPNSHFGLFLYTFCERTNNSCASLAEYTGLSKDRLKRYIATDQKPSIETVIILSSKLAQIAKTTKYRMLQRIVDAVEKDLKKAPFPPKRRIQC